MTQQPKEICQTTCRGPMSSYLCLHNTFVRILKKELPTYIEPFWTSSLPSCPCNFSNGNSICILHTYSPNLHKEIFEAWNDKVSLPCRRSSTTYMCSGKFFKFWVRFKIYKIMHLNAKLWNQVPSLDHLVIQNSGNFLCWKYGQVGRFYVSNFRQ